VNIMTHLAVIVFWLCCSLLCYTYFVYPSILFVCYAFVQLCSDLRFLLGRRERRVTPVGSNDIPGISFVIAAYNEERNLAAKLTNLRQMTYPAEKLQIIFVSDGSTDGTNKLLESVSDAFVETIFRPERSGKPLALNCGVEHARYDILVFSDASTLFAPEAIANMVRHFRDPRIGAVCGSLQLLGNDESERTEGTYWQFERVLRLMESRLGATVNASGAIYALRRKCFVPLVAGDLLDDLLIPMKARKLGYKVMEDPEAGATDCSADTVKGEFTRRTRIAVGSFRALRRMDFAALRGFTGFAFVSHKLLRWLLPFFLIFMLVSNAFLMRKSFYGAAFVAQAAFYLWASLGFLFHKRMKQTRIVLLPYFLLTVHLAFLVGFWRCCFGEYQATWERVS